MHVTHGQLEWVAVGVGLLAPWIWLSLIDRYLTSSRERASDAGGGR
jgi:hypothetical protein